MIQKAIKYILTNDATFSAAIGTYTLDGTATTMKKIFPGGYAPQGATLPYCTHQLNNSEPFPTKDEASDQDNDHVLVTVYADDYDEVMNLAGYVRDALDKIAATVYNTVTVNSIDFVRWNDGFMISGEKPVFFYEIEFECFNVK